MMRNKDKGRYVRAHGIKVGDKVLKEQKATTTPSTTPSPRSTAIRSRTNEERR